MMSKLTMLLAALTLAAVVAGGALAAGTAADRPATTAHRCAKGKKHKIVRGKHFCVRVAKPKPKPPVNVQLLAINDFHGNLEPPTGSSGRVQTGVNADGSAVTVDAGGMEYLSTQ